MNFIKLLNDQDLHIYKKVVGLTLIRGPLFYSDKSWPTKCVIKPCDGENHYD